MPLNRSDVARRLACGAGLIALAAAFTGCASPQQRNMMAEQAMRAGEMQWDAEEEQFCYLYQYYPDSQVYRSVYHYNWFWQEESGAWKSGDELPAGTPAPDRFVLIELPTGNPGKMHEMVAMDHPSNDVLFAQAQALSVEMGISPYDEMPADEAFATVPTTSADPRD